MAKQYGRNVMIMYSGAESEYGTLNKTVTGNFIQGTMTINAGIEVIETNAKTGTRYKRELQYKQGLKKPTATISGEISSANLDELLNMFFGDTEPWGIPATDGTSGFSFYNVDLVGATYDYIKGCKIETLEIVGTQGETLKINMTLRGDDTDFDVANSAGTALTNSTSSYMATPFYFHDVTADINGKGSYVSDLISFNLSLTNVFQDDNLSHFNNQTRQQDVICRVDGMVGYSFQADTDDNTYIFDNLINVVREFKLKLIRGGTDYDFVMQGRIINYEKPTDAECQIIIPVQMEINYNDSNSIAPIVITKTIT